jgi:hypothetical protein
MHRISRCISVLGAIAIAIAIALVSVAACGGSGSDEIVARVAGVGSISKGTVEHWIPIQARLTHSVVPTKPVPKGVVPDPPAYPACIAYLKTTQKITETGPKPTIAQLRSRCAQQYQTLKLNVLNLLISWDWEIGSGAATGMKVTDSDVRRRLETIRKNDLVDVSFKKYLKWTGQTEADMLLRSRVQLFEVKFRDRAIAMLSHLPPGLTAQQRQQAIAKLSAGQPTPSQWVARTSCRPGYVTSSCRQYKSSLPPGRPN